MNKKIAIIIAGVLCLAVAATVAYFIFGRSPKDEFCSVIPRNAVMVGRLAPMEFLEKNDLTLEEAAERAGVPSRFVKMAQSYLENSGIDITRPIYFFADEKLNFGGVVKLNDAKEFKSLLETEGKMKVKKDGDLNYAILIPNAFICFDDEKAMFYANANGKVKEAMMDKLMNQKADESVMGEKIFKQLVDANKSFAVNLEYKAYMDVMKDYGNAADMGALSALNMIVPDCNALITWDINDDKAILATDIYPNSDKAEKELDELLNKLTPIKGDLCDKGLTNPVAWMVFNFPSKSVNEMVKQIPGLDVALAQIGQEIDIEGTLNCLSGDVTVALNNNLDAQIPEFLLMAQTQMEPSALVKTLGQVAQLSDARSSDVNLVQDDSNNYRVTKLTYDWYNDESDEEVDEFDAFDEYIDDDYEEPIFAPAPINQRGEDVAFIRVDYNCLIASNNKALMDNANKKSDAMKAYKGDMKGSIFYAVVDFQAFCEAFQTSKMAESATKDPTTFVLVKTLKNFKDITIKAEKRHVEMVCTTMNGKKFLDIVLDACYNANK